VGLICMAVLSEAAAALFKGGNFSKVYSFMFFGNHGSSEALKLRYFINTYYIHFSPRVHESVWTYDVPYGESAPGKWAGSFSPLSRCR
jgi:hypothetical protein